MPINFKYVPLAPESLSGPAFIEQTEKAFNELGAEIDSNTAIANEALTTANSASETANEALEIAQQTAGSSDNAVIMATEALSNSQTAITTANNAYDAATNAVSVSNAANTTANIALNNSVTAIDTAETAAQDISVAVDTALNAQIVAQNALALAASANDEYITDASIRNVNDAYDTPERSYLVNTANTNLPVSMPCFFNAIVNDVASSATQQCWNDETTLYRRFATIDNTDPENLIVTWSEWAALSTDSSGTLGGGFNKKDFIFESGVYAPPVTGWYKVTLVGGGGSGGCGGNFNYTAVTTADIIGASGGGGGAGEVADAYLYLDVADTINVTIGAGGASGSANSSTPQALAGTGYGGQTRIVIISDGGNIVKTYAVLGGSPATAGTISNTQIYGAGKPGTTSFLNRQTDDYLENSDSIRMVNSRGGNGTRGEQGVLGTTQMYWIGTRVTHGGDGGNNGSGFGGGGGGGCGQSTLVSGTIKLQGFGGKGGDGGSIVLEYDMTPMPGEEDKTVYLYHGAGGSGTNGIGGAGGNGVAIFEYFDPSL